jgi:hypothetical protein
VEALLATPRGPASGSSRVEDEDDEFENEDDWLRLRRARRHADLALETHFR